MIRLKEMSGSMILEWTFCDLLTAKVDFLSSQNLLTATVLTKEPAFYLNENFYC